MVTFQATTRGTARTGKLATEYLWMNYPDPAALHDYRYLGSNFRQRECIRRKTARWVRRINSLPELERKALLSAMGAGRYRTDENDAAGSSGAGDEGARPIPVFQAISDRASADAEVLQ